MYFQSRHPTPRLPHTRKFSAAATQRIGRRRQRSKQRDTLVSASLDYPYLLLLLLHDDDDDVDRRYTKPAVDRCE